MKKEETRAVLFWSFSHVCFSLYISPQAGIFSPVSTPLILSYPWSLITHGQNSCNSGEVFVLDVFNSNILSLCGVCGFTLWNAVWGLAEVVQTKNIFCFALTRTSYYSTFDVFIARPHCQRETLWACQYLFAFRLLLSSYQIMATYLVIKRFCKRNVHNILMYFIIHSQLWPFVVIFWQNICSSFQTLVYILLD